MAGPAPAMLVAQPSTQAVTANGKSVEFAMYALKDAGGSLTNYIRVRDLTQALAFNVGWDNHKGVYVETNTPYGPNN